MILRREISSTRRTNMSQCQFPLHKSHTDWLRIEPHLRGDKPATNWRSHDAALKTKVILKYTYRFSYRTAEKTRPVSIIKTSQLMLYREIFAIYFESYKADTKHRVGRTCIYLC
jgi:hypothetical protein